jgi:hypothetical protein
MSSRRIGKQSNDGSYQSELRRAISRYLPHEGLATLPGNRLQRWTARLLVIGAILMAWDPGQTLVDRFESAYSFLAKSFGSRRRPGRTYVGFIAALARKSETLLATVSKHLRRCVQNAAGDRWTIGGWVVLGFDGSKINCPMTKANEDGFGLASRAKSWPQMLLTMMFHVGTGLPWAFLRDGAKGSERSHLIRMLCSLPEAAKTMVVADAGLTGYDVLSAVLGAGHSFILRVGANVQLLTGLGYAIREFDGLVYLWPENKQKKKLAPLVLRLITLIDGRNRKMHLLTNVLDSSLLSDKTAQEIYTRRWLVELMYRSLKQVMGRRKMLSDSPRNAEVELDWSVTGLWVLALMNHEAIGARGRPSAATTLRAVRAKMAGRGRSLHKALEKAVQDNYQRTASKKARHWPHKKKEKPPGSPRARKATKAEITLATELLRRKAAA